MLTSFSITGTWFSSKRTTNNANSTNRAGKGSPVIRTVCGARINSLKRGYLFYSLQSQSPKILTVWMPEMWKDYRDVQSKENLSLKNGNTKTITSCGSTIYYNKLRLPKFSKYDIWVKKKNHIKWKQTKKHNSKKTAKIPEKVSGVCSQSTLPPALVQSLWDQVFYQKDKLILLMLTWTCW